MQNSKVGLEFGVVGQRFLALAKLESSEDNFQSMYEGVLSA